ncbi:MAG: GTP 3',8-cyclase MoaA [Acidobacteria bacterium]|nr:MAG: GTP 3',8-cyclase MoaA [Acidobacteriota bacterium]REJ99107.1 MAG: GTP 3',8-cyclase MoaA [Acidobacteriota bacterium]REK16172.1 MAG: GTP 3',8-cyclase MoaA [Acidobacteriota bacterium]REK43853.1 MAG: GTP 3',8-cyclase MoaA [Acidobacteriota bacterium]
MSEVLTDAYGRQIRDLRISVTDRCQFRCFYCLPDGEPPLARKDTILSFEEIERISSVFVSLGIEKVRLTGGEPMLRRDIEKLVTAIARLKPKGLRDIALTTNGFSIPEKAALLKDSGLDRITISLDSLDPDNFKDITGVDKLDDVLKAIEAAQTAGLDPVKINAVVVRGRNDHELPAFARFARETGVSMRFIEFMPLDSGHGWNREQVVSGREIRTAIEEQYPLELKRDSRGTETAWRYGFKDGAPGEIGIIAPVTEMFCGQCSRIRLTADGQIRTCLFSTVEHDLREVVRSGADDEGVAEYIRAVTLQKEASHHINETDFVQPERTMSFIGG